MNVAFFYPSQELGGAEILVARMAEQMARRGHQVLIIDGEQRVIISLCQDLDVETRVVERGAPIKLSGWSIVAFASHLSNVHEWVWPESDCRIIFWSVHPLNLIHLPAHIGSWLASTSFKLLRLVNLAIFRAEYRARRTAITRVLEKKALKFMDGENYRVVSDFYGFKETEIDYLPIPVPDLSGRFVSRADHVLTRSINIFWYGRICDFKVNGLVALVEGITHCSDRVALHIIGSGDQLDVFERACEKYKVQVSFYGTLSNKDARTLIAQKADMVISMGTAALEAAQLGVPTALAPVSYKPLPARSRFVWLHNSRNFDLGFFAASTSQQAGEEIFELVEQVKKNTALLSQRCKSHVECFHSMAAIASKMELDLQSNAHQYDEDFLNLSRYKPSVLVRIYRAVKLRVVKWKK